MYYLTYILLVKLNVHIYIYITTEVQTIFNNHNYIHSCSWQVATETVIKV